MGRFFLIILGTQCVDKVIYLIQVVAIPDLSLPYWEIDKGISPRSLETKLCVVIGFCKVICDFMAQIYAFFLALLITQVLKDPIHKLQGYIYLYHAITITISLALTLSLLFGHQFGVEVSQSHTIHNDCLFVVSRLYLQYLYLFY